MYHLRLELHVSVSGYNKEVTYKRDTVTHNRRCSSAREVTKER